MKKKSIKKRILIALVILLAVFFLVSVNKGTDGSKDLFYGLKEFRLGSILFPYFCDDFINIRHNTIPPKYSAIFNCLLRRAKNRTLY